MPILFALGVLGLAPAIAHAQQPDSVTVRWTAPGDDGRIGRATAYDMRSSDAPITEANFGSGSPVNGLPAPQPSGTMQQVIVRGLAFGTRYYFAVKAVDDDGNWSAISNVVVWDWVYDTSPPAAPRGGGATRDASGVRVSWLANTESDLAGYHVYRATAAGGPFTRLTTSLVTTNQYLDTGVAPGTSDVWYQVTAVDVSNNESPRSLAFSLALSTTGAEWVIESGYPNPSKGGESVRIPVVLPIAGSVSAFVDIVDAAGRRVRRIDLSSFSPGAQEVVWDGRNDAGRDVASGLYLAVVSSGPDRRTVKIAVER